MCGLRQKWNPNVGIHRICKTHKSILRGQIQSKTRYIYTNGLKIPISPDGIPMVNLAQPQTPQTGRSNDGLSNSNSETNLLKP
jgi:hypothetical protein